MQGTTKSGFQFNVNDKVLKDWRFTMALTKMEKHKTPFDALQGMNEMAELLLGDDMNKFFEHIKSQNEGLVPFEIVTAELKEILEQFPKN